MHCFFLWLTNKNIIIEECVLIKRLTVRFVIAFAERQVSRKPGSFGKGPGF